MTDEITIAARARGESTVVDELCGTEPWRPRLVGSDRACARVVLVQTRAALISGDEIRLAFAVGTGATLLVDELAATLAHDARGGVPARVSVGVEIAAGGTLVWLAQPLIVAGGALVERTVGASLSRGARLLLGETIALGRAGEPAGELVSRTRITIRRPPSRR